MQPWRCDHAGTFCVGEIVQTPDKLLLFNVSASNLQLSLNTANE